jgi:UPF0176 protein
MQKILLYYKFTPIADPEAMRLWQRTLCDSVGVKGRILISKHGINGTLGGDLQALKAYVKQTKHYSGFKDTEFKWSDGTGQDFPKLAVRVRDEIVTFGAAEEIEVNEQGIIGGGKHLKPKQVHELVEKRGQDVIFFDGRNAYEAEVGRFKNAVVPNVDRTRDFATELDDPKYDAIKDKPIVTYCTGGIRCEVLSMMMKKRGFKDVYQMDGGIVKYGEAYKDEGLWEGSLYVFDDRMGLKFSDKAIDIASCVYCGEKTSNFENCANLSCNKLTLICHDCHSSKAVCPSCTRATPAKISQSQERSLRK